MELDLTSCSVVPKLIRVAMQATRPRIRIGTRREREATAWEVDELSLLCGCAVICVAVSERTEGTSSTQQQAI